MPALIDADDEDDEDEKKPLIAPSSDILLPVMENSDDDDERGQAASSSDNNAPSSGTVKMGTESLSLDPSRKCFGPCGGKTCKEREQWHLCRNNFNDFVKCKNIVGEQCQISHDGYCRICIIAGATASKRYSSINLYMTYLNVIINVFKSIYRREETVNTPTLLDLTSAQINVTKSPLRYPKDLSSERFCLLELSDINRLLPNQPEPTSMYASDATADFCMLYMDINKANARLQNNVFIPSALMHSHLSSLKLGNNFSSAWYIRSNKLDGVNDLLIPIVGDDHFSALVIRNIRSLTPVFYHYDSLVNYHNTEEIVELFTEYIQALQQAERGADGDDEYPVKIKSIVVKLKGPVQGNSFDCGIYMLKFFQQILDSNECLQTFLESFNNTAWSQDDVLNYRKAMYEIAIRLYDENETNQNMIATQNIVRSIEESRYSTKHKELKCDQQAPHKKASIDSYILEKFGSMHNYIRLVPNPNDQEYIRLSYNQNQSLIDTFSTKRKTINCGYQRGEFVIFSRYYFNMALSWAPTNTSCWDRIPFSYDRFPKTYGHVNFAALQGPNRQVYFASSPLYSNSDGYRYILWICHLTTCSKPIKEWTLFDTQTERFNVVKGNNYSFLMC